MAGASSGHWKKPHKGQVENISMYLYSQLTIYWNMNNLTYVAGLELGLSELEIVPEESILSLPWTE